MFSRKKLPASHSVAIGAWGLAVVAGVLSLGAYAGRPGDAGIPADRWPRESRIRFDATRPNLLIFLHPRCPCSRASLAELSRVMARGHGRLTARAILLRPSGAPEGWADSDIVRDAAAIPGVLAFCDEDGDEALRFGAATSGHVMLYDAAGRLHFSGGITPARGHEGDSLGRDAVIDLIEASGSAGRRCGPVFGCPLATPRTAPGPKDTQRPEMDGFEAASAVRAGDRGTGLRLPVIAPAAHARKGDRERILTSGFNAYLSKPPRAEELC